MRAKGKGGRIDYFLVPEENMEHVKSASILGDIMGSDHCPIHIELDMKGQSDNSEMKKLKAMECMKKKNLKKP